MKVLKYLLILPVFILAVSCSKKPATYEQVIENGIKITKNTGVPADSSFKIELKEVATISLESESGFISPPDYDYHFDSSGNLYFVDYMTYKIHKFSPDGKSAAVFGGKGQGPGEFIAQPHIFISGDTLYAAEVNMRRVSKLDFNGKFISEKIISDINKIPRNIKKIGKNYINSVDYARMDESGQRYSVVSAGLLDEKLNYVKDIYYNEKKVDMSLESDPSEQGVCVTAGNGYAYLNVNSKNDYAIDVYDENGNKVRRISKNYIRIESSREDKELQEDFNKKYGLKFKTLYYNSIYNLRLDKYNRLWVSSRVLGKEEDHNYDIFIDDVFQKRINIKMENGYLITYVGQKIIAVNYQAGMIKMYEY